MKRIDFKSFIGVWSLIFCCLPVTLFADIHEIRKSFHSALLNEENIETFHSLMDSNVDTEPTIVAYQAVSKALMAQKVWNPIDKYIYIKNFHSLMDKALKEDSLNLEIRFLRFSVEYHIPPWLGYSEHLEEDIKFININSYKVSQLMFDDNYIRYISYFIRHTNLFTKEELIVILNNLENSPADS
ncbi:MAG: hypothetical protein JXR03_16660 [Cyclobacteriaceae bacterium]